MRPQAPSLQPQGDLFTRALDGILHLLFRLVRYLGRRLVQSPIVGLAYILIALPACFLIVQDVRQMLAVAGTAGTPRFDAVPRMWPLSEPLPAAALVCLFAAISLVVVFDRWTEYRGRTRGREAAKPEPIRIEDWVLGRACRRVWNPDPGEFRLEPTGELYRLKEEHLRTHMIVVAPTGSGKTVSVLEPALHFFKRTGAAAIYLDAKGDSFDPAQFHLNFDLNNPEGSMRLLVWSGRTPREMAERLGEALVSETGTEHPYYVRTAKDTLAALVGAHHRAYREMPSLSLLLTYLRSAEAREDLAEQLRTAGVQEYGSELEDVGHVSKLAEQKNDVLGSLDTALAPLCRGAVAQLLVGDPARGYSIEQLVSQPVRVRFAISTHDHPRIAPIIGRLVMAQFTYAVVSPNCNKAILKAMVADEAKHFVTGTVADGMAMARENRGAYLLAFQNLSQIADSTLRQDILSVAGNKLVMAGVDDYDAEKFSRLFGSREQQYVSRSQNSSQGSNNSRSRGSGREGGDLLGGAVGSLRHQSSHVQSSSMHQSQGSSSQVRERANFLPSEIRELPQFHVLIERRGSRGEITPATVVSMDYELISGVRDMQALKLYEQVGRLEAISPNLPPHGALAPGHGGQVLDTGASRADRQHTGVCMYRHLAPEQEAVPFSTPAPNRDSVQQPAADGVPTLEGVAVSETGESMGHGTADPEWVDAAARDIARLLGIDETQARRLAHVAFNNGRDADYLSDNLRYVRSASKVKSPAGLFAFLVKSNQHKTGARAALKGSSKGAEIARDEAMAQGAEGEEGEEGKQELEEQVQEMRSGTA
jgi:hypothetical protein